MADLISTRFPVRENRLIHGKSRRDYSSPDGGITISRRLNSFFLVDRESFEKHETSLPSSVIFFEFSCNDKSYRMMQKILGGTFQNLQTSGKFYFPTPRISSLPLFRNYTKEHVGIMYRLRAWRREKKY